MTPNPNPSPEGNDHARGPIWREVQSIQTQAGREDWPVDRYRAVLLATLSPQTLPAPGEVVEAPENGEPDPEWRAIRRAIDQFVGRVPVISKHRAIHNTTLAETVARLDAAGDREAADTIVWLCWFRALDRERERFLLADAAEKSATVAEAYARGVEAAAKVADEYEQHTGDPAFDAATDVAAVTIAERIRLLPQGGGK